MSKAFTKDDATTSEILVVPRAPLPVGPNYVTPRGLQLLLRERAMLDEERRARKAQNSPDLALQTQALAERAFELQARLASAKVVDPALEPRDEVRFGARVRVRQASGKESEFQIVGVDEADAAAGLLAFSAPLSRALLGKRVGDVAELNTPRASEEFEVLAIDYGPAPVSDPPNAKKSG